MLNKKLLCSLILGASALSLANAAETLRLSTYVNENDIRYEGFQHFAELVNEKTKGEVEIKIFPSSTLHGWSEGVDAVQGGVSDISWIPADNRLNCYRTTSLYPIHIDLENQVELDAAYAGLIKGEAEKNGLVPLFNSNYSYLSLSILFPFSSILSAFLFLPPVILLFPFFCYIFSSLSLSLSIHLLLLFTTQANHKETRRRENQGHTHTHIHTHTS